MSLDTFNLSRPQKRKLKRLTDKLDSLLDADRRFFERRPDRSYRVRRAFKPENEIVDLLAEDGDPIPEGMVRLFIVRQIRPGLRMRVYAKGSDWLEPDLWSDEQCRAVYEAVATSPKHREIERGLEAIGKGVDP
jgi:hypothetical protein